MSFFRTIAIIGLTLVIAACSSRDGDVVLTRQKSDSEGPDEFSIAPGLPLQEPSSYSELPAPTPGQANLTDVDARADGILALGGNPRVLQAGISTNDTSLVSHTNRYGTQGSIREVLRAEDEDIRRSYGVRNVLRIGPRDDYTEAYKRQWLDAEVEQNRLRRAGIITPTAPPQSR